MSAHAGRRSRRWSAIALIAVVALTLASFLLGRSLKSPASIVDAATPPQPSIITALVTQKPLVQRLTGTATTTQSVAATIPLASAAADGSQPVVTASPLRAGATVAEGDVVLEVSGTPILALAGAFPSYRTITIGTTGPDVEQLHEALDRLGARSNDPEATFGADTARALSAILKSRGYPAAITAVPAGSLAYLPASGLRLASAPPGVGTRLDADSAMSLSTAQPTVTASFPVTGDSVPTAGLAVTLTDPSGASVKGTVGSVAAPTTDDSGRTTVAAQITTSIAVTIPSAEPWPAVAEITVAPKDSLIVPSTAVFSRDTSTSVVQVLDTNQNLSDVAVDIIAEQAGSAAVTPLTNGALKVGARVVVGQR